MTEHELRAELDALAADRARLQQENDEWRTGAHADATGHLHRCAKVNGTWVCADGCAKQALTQLQQALRQFPRYWVTIDRAFPEPMACLKAEVRADGEWVKYEDIQRLKTDA